MICNENSTLLPSWDASNSSACVVDYCMNLMDIARKETCGKCVFCREGTLQIYEIIKEITEGNAESGDAELLLDVLSQIEKGGSCEMSKTAASRCIEMMKTYEEDWDLHIRRKRCSKLVCKGMYTLYIDPQLCDGCGKCLEVCSDGNILGGTGMIHVIQGSSGNDKAKELIAVCPKGAIKKAGAVKPKLPSEPVPVGSFGQDGGDSEEGTGRRRRRRG
jgi:NAD-dependent dihydropyrimidine dehydrogenase PreA subunit